ncbi:hypothetical protein PABG_05930 [Paracoccidioides brasiliensis Pb03]|nr:hypothetical protein PABG_05930 [Paracoccidioides brasiliensis Pb03]
MAGGLFCETPIQKRGVGGLRLTGLAFYVGARSSYSPHTYYEGGGGGSPVESEEEELLKTRNYRPTLTDMVDQR